MKNTSANNKKSPWLPLALTLAVNAAMPLAYAAEAIHIRAQPLGQALSELGQQTSLQVFFSPDLVAGKQAPAVDGNLSPEQALRHPTWDMGRVVTTNSASLVNKALEVIEAHLLFDVPLDRIDVVVHPQSVVHSMVEFVDGSTLAQASPPDMRLPIALGLCWPRRLPGAAPACDWTRAATWTFEPLDEEAFPAVRAAKEAAAASPTHMAVFNAANEESVDAFHAGALPFDGIVDTVRAVVADYAPEHVLAAAGHDPAPTGLTVDAVLAAEAWARRAARARW